MKKIKGLKINIELTPEIRQKLDMFLISDRSKSQKELVQELFHAAVRREERRRKIGNKKAN